MKVDVRPEAIYLGLQFVASLISQGAQIVTIRQSDPFVLV